jgi:predicted metal-dependent hydrolase
VSSELLFAHGGVRRPLIVRRVANARRMRLAVDPRDGAVRLTLPRRAALKPAQTWAESQRGWIEQALAKVPQHQPLGPGSTVPFAGEMLHIAWREAGSRVVRRDGGQLLVGGPEAMVAPRVLRWLRAEAGRTLDTETRALAAQAGVTVGRVRIGDPRSRWGSCSTGGDINYSWRLILMPPAVRAAIVAHEVAHRVHMNHGPDFHALVKQLLGRTPKAEQAWLKAHGAEMQRVGR